MQKILISITTTYINAIPIFSETPLQSYSKGNYLSFYSVTIGKMKGMGFCKKTQN
jgi:hypothetical protein